MMLDFKRCLLALTTAVSVLAVINQSDAQPVSVMDGPYQIMTMDLPDGQVMVTVMLRRSTATDMAYYQGPCTASIEADLSVSDEDAKRAFEASGKFEDLNASELTDRFTEYLPNECAAVQTIDAVLATRPDRPVVASFAKSSGWQNTLGALDAEAAANPLDDLMPKAPTGPVIPFAANDPFTRIGTRAYVACETESTIPMGSTTIAATRQPRLSEYRQFAEAAAPHFKTACPEVERIKFRPSAAPAGMTCQVEGADCYFDARLSGGAWTVTAAGYDRPDTSEDINTFDDVIALMVARDYAKLRGSYTGYYRQFHNEFLAVYSDNCASQIDNPVTYEITPMERTIDENGFTIASRQAGRTFTLTMDRKFDAPYFAYERAIKLRLTSKILESALDARDGGPSSTGIEAVVGQVISDRQLIQQFVSQGCTAPDVQTVYDGLDQVLGG